LLRAEEALIPFAPEGKPFLQTQLQWATTTPYPVGVRLLTGEGGTGKTRLAIEMCQRLAAAGWHSGFLRNTLGPKDCGGLVRELAQANRPTLIVLDYAETRTDMLLKLLSEVLSQLQPQALAQTSPPTVRILLLARSSGEWWGRLPGINGRCEALLTGRATTGPYLVPALYTDPALRQTAYAQALATFAGVLQRPAPPVQPDLQAPAYDKPLFLHMAALLALLGERTESAEALPMALVRHEKRYWHKVAHSAAPSQRDARSLEKDSELLMALVTLVGSAARPHDIAPLWQVAEGDAPQPKPLFNALAALYPGTQGLSGLRPDLLGEALVAQQLLGSGGEALLNAVLGNAATQAQRHHALTVLSRLLRDREDLFLPIENALTQHFSLCAKDIVKVILQTPSRLPQVAEKSFQRLPMNLALQVAGQLEADFEHDVLPLSGLKLRIFQTLNTQAEKRCKGTAKPSTDDKSHWARTLRNLGVAYHQIGDNTQALDYAKQALDIYVRLAQGKPERFEPDWAISINDYANLLSDKGDNTLALVYAKQALDIRARLAKDKPERFEPDWAMSLNNYATRLSDNGDNTQALICAKQALDIRQRLAKDQPERFEPVWARSLNNYANHLSDKGDSTQALVYAKQALDIYARLAQDKPERFEPDWAMSLGNYANALSDNGDSTQALACTKHALDIRARLAQDKPERFEPDWAASLYNYATRLSDNGDSTQALDYAEQALDIYVRLAESNPKKYIADAEYNQLHVAILAWLATGAELVIAAEAAPDSALDYNRRPNRFYRYVLLALAANDPAHAASALENAWQAWGAMSKAQQKHWEKVFLLACGFAAARAALPPAFGTWQVQLSQLKTRRKSSLPQWMEEIARRKGFALV
jgi:tetratricopeptide (TPR) repeat protein